MNKINILADSRKILFVPVWLAKLIFVVSVVAVVYMYGHASIDVIKDIAAGNFGSNYHEQPASQDERVSSLQNAFK
ncbi:MAG: hypothetical protein IJ228_10605 [Succinivibrio sp.]|nr:hypothetical protein [Succinivibrio sp.]